MTVRQRRLPGRRASALMLAAALAAGGITYAGFHTGSETAPSSAPSAGKADSRPRPETVDGQTAFALAKKSGKPVEVTAERTARSTTWARPDGLMMLRSYAAPVRAKVGQEWKPIDTTLRRTGEGWQPKATNTHVVFSAGGQGGERASRGGVRQVSLLPALTSEEGVTSPLVALTVTDVEGLEHTIQLTWPGTVPTPIIDGSRALYPEILPGADLVLTAQDDGFAQLLVVKNRQAAADPRIAQLSYGISSPTLDFRLDPLSGIVAAETSRGDEVALSPTPLMWDSSGAPAVTDGQAGASAQPTASETPEASPPTPPTAAPAPSSTEVLADDVVDPENEVLPTATDGTAPAVSDPPLPTVPGEPTPAPSQPEAGATLNLPLLNGPSPESRGDVVEADLSQGNWTLTPSTDFLSDPATVYPVFIDPTVKKHTQNWTTAYSRHPNATFFDGKGFNKGGTHEARVGFESDTWGTSRSFFNIAFDKKIKGAKVQKATLRVLETYSWSCSARSMSVHLTSAVTNRTNWNNAPSLHDGNIATPVRSFAHGYKTGCRDDYETFDVTAAAQTTANKGKDTITFGLRARNEKSQYAWKKFQADGDNAPVLEVTYNRPPRSPDEFDLGPDFKCTTSAPYVRVGSTDINFTARAGDWDDNLDYLDFNLWPAGKWDTTGDLLGSTGTVSVGAATTDAKRSTSAFPTSRLVNNTLYSWQVRAVDKAGATSAFAPYKAPCRFIYDSSAPRPPLVTSTAFPNADGKDNAFGNEPEDTNWSKIKFGSTGVVTLLARESDVVRYEWGYNTNSFPESISRTLGTATDVKQNINAKPPAAGPNVLYVRVVDGAGHVSEPTKYFFYVTPKEQADAPGDFTGDTLPDLFSLTSGGNLRLFPSQQAPGSSPVKGNGDTDFSMSGAYQENPDKDPNGDNLEPFIAPPAGHFSGALITHNGDFYGGDGLQDLIARVGGKLWVYPGDGYGAVNINRRREILLPGNSPSPSSLSQIVATGDITGDKLPDMFATTGDQMWAFIGYNGASFTEARLVASSPWADRDILTVADISGDTVPDLLFRSAETERGLLLRHGKPAAGGGVDLNSLTTAAGSKTGQDEVYGTTGWGKTNIPKIIGTPDVNKDGIPDLWACLSDGRLYFYPGGRTTHGTRFLSSASGWLTATTIG
ncbi:DNRLRE domain-containing protein [Streptomyces hydrogenans]|uniref:DNRLRE domain-containing protein n=1 Tax=Streptomyces hydrogenans TaxID=1873719 RepID=UPI0035E2D237